MTKPKFKKGDTVIDINDGSVLEILKVYQEYNFKGYHMETVEHINLREIGTLYYVPMYFAHTNFVKATTNSRILYGPK